MFGAFMALLSLTSCYNGNSNENVTSTLSFDEVLTSRRSVRNYDASKKITEAEVRDLIKAAQEAPSWANQQPTKYYVAISEEKLAAVQDMVGGNKSVKRNWQLCRIWLVAIRNVSRMHLFLSFQPLNVASLASSRATKPTRWVTDGEPMTMGLVTVI